MSRIRITSMGGYWTVSTPPGWGMDYQQSAWLAFDTGAHAIAYVDKALRERRVQPLNLGRRWHVA